MDIPRRAPAVALLLLWGLAGCGDSDSSSRPRPPATPGTPSATASIAPTATATAPPTATDTTSPTRTRTIAPSATPSSAPTASPTVTPTSGPSPLEQLLSVPERERWTLHGLSGPAYVVRTEANVPHLYAATRRDLATVQGFVVARDRYFMMDLARRLSEGRVAELIGDLALDLDQQSRGRALTYMTDRILTAFSAEQAELADGFAAGVNAYIAQVALGALPPPSELGLASLLLGKAPIDLMAPFARRDVAAIIATVATQASFNDDDVARAAAHAALPGLFEGAPFAALRHAGVDGDVLTAIAPAFPVTSTRGFGLEMGDEFIPGPTAETSAAAAPAASAASAAALDAQRLAALHRRFERFGRLQRRARGGDTGSNVWAISGAATADGAALLAGDAHQSLDVPCIYVQIGLDTAVLGGGDIHQLGQVVPGLPGMLLGTNGRVAWSGTTLHGDITDWYREELQLDAAGLPSHSRFAGEWRPLQRSEDTYVIADVPALGSAGRSETWARWTTFDGRWLVEVEGRAPAPNEEPAENESIINVAGQTVIPGDADGDGVVSAVSFDYSGLDVERIIDPVDAFGRADDVFALRQAARGLIAYDNNTIAADADGNIVYVPYQATPCRGYLERTAAGEWAAGANPLLLLDGTRYGGFTIPMAAGRVDENAAGGDPYRCVVPFDAFPQAINPARHYLMNANNQPAPIANDGSFADDPWYIGGPFNTAWRSQLVDRKVAAAAAGGDADVARIAAVQATHESPLGRDLAPRLLEAIGRARQLSQIDRPLTPAEQRVVDRYLAEAAAFDAVERRLVEWGTRGYVAASGVETFYSGPVVDEHDDAVATMLFNAWLARVVTGVWDDEGLPLAVFWRNDETRVLLLRRFLDARDSGGADGLASFNPDTGESTFFDVVDTPEVETSREVILTALADALAFLRAAPTGKGQGGFGTDDMDQWLWGLRHQVRFESLVAPFLGDNPVLGFFTDAFAIDTKILPLAPALPAGDPRADLRWFPRPGDNYSLDAAGPGFSGTDFTYNHGPVMRIIVRLKDGAVSGQNVIPGGQSGLVESPHFADQAALWLGNQAVPLRFTVAEVVAGATGRETFDAE